MANKRGTLSINSENIFPIIKKWLYSDHDIFVREMISNGCDAITKLKKLEVMGDYTFPEGHKNKIDVIVNPEEKTLKFIDTGLGMTADEVEEYITQIAFSGATQFLEKYKDKILVLQSFWKNIKTRLMTTRSSDISDWDSILLLWLRMRYTLIPFPIKKAPSRYTGSVMAVQNTRWEKETVQKLVQRLRCS